MAVLTAWTDHPATGSTRIRAVHINELRTAVDGHRATYGLPAYPWTDNPITSTTRIRAVHFAELRDAIQELWDRRGLGAIPAWNAGSPPSSNARRISSCDINDLRAWLNQYEGI